MALATLLVNGFFQACWLAFGCVGLATVVGMIAYCHDVKKEQKDNQK